MEQFKKDVDVGLSGKPKFLSSKYFYDKKGDALFVEIMKMPEYYLTRAELEIFSERTDDIIKALGADKEEYFELIELGPGDGIKTKHLLKKLDAGGFSFDYFPLDISEHALTGLEKTLAEELPNVSVKKRQGDYFEILSAIKESKNRKVILFLGSNIGNLTDELARKFIYGLGANLKPDDKVLLGVDLIKAESIVLPAYNDTHGITRDFNLNLLERINRELGGDFDIDTFEHAPEYTEEEGIAKSFLQSKLEQDVTISAIDKTFHFEEGEKIHTEISRKYSDEIIQNILKETDFEIADKLMDDERLFADYVLERC